MRAPKRPPEGWPWEGRVPMFSIPNWPPGFVPADMKKGEFDDFTRSQTAAKAREVQIANGHTGSIHGMSSKSDKRLQNANRVRQLVPKR